MLNIQHQEKPDLLMVGIDEKNYSDAAKVSAFRRLQNIFITLGLPYEVAEHVTPNSVTRIVTVDASWVDEVKTIATLFGKPHMYAATIEDKELVVKDASLTFKPTYSNARKLKQVSQKQAEKLGSYLRLISSEPESTDIFYATVKE